MPQTQKLSHRLSVVTLLLVGGALVLGLFPGLSRWLIYDRQAILSGEIWRLFTGHWVHFSTSHLVYDTLALGLAGWMVEARQLPHFGWLCLLAPWAIGGALLVCCPGLAYYGGLSGLATCALTFLALNGLNDASNWRWICRLALAGVAGKILFERQTGHLLFATITSGTVKVSVASHLAGAITALIFYKDGKVLFRLRQRRADRDAQDIRHGTFLGV